MPRKASNEMIACASGEQTTPLDVCFDSAAGERTSLRDLMRKNKKHRIVVASFPKAGTPGCTKQIRAFNDIYTEIQGLGFEVVGASLDTPTAQQSFCTKLSVQFPLAVEASELLEKLECISSQKKVIRSIVALDDKGNMIYEARKVKPMECSLEFKAFAEGLAAKEAAEAPKGKSAKKNENKDSSANEKKNLEAPSTTNAAKTSATTGTKGKKTDAATKSKKPSEIKESSGKGDTKGKKQAPSNKILPASGAPSATSAANPKGATKPPPPEKSAKAVKKIDIKKSRKRSQ